MVLPAKLGIYARRGGDSNGGAGAGAGAGGGTGSGAGAPAWTITARNPKKLGNVHATATIEEL